MNKFHSQAEANNLPFCASTEQKQEYLTSAILPSFNPQEPWNSFGKAYEVQCDHGQVSFFLCHHNKEGDQWIAMFTNSRTRSNWLNLLQESFRFDIRKIFLPIRIIEQ